MILERYQPEFIIAKPSTYKPTPIPTKQSSSLFPFPKSACFLNLGRRRCLDIALFLLAH